MIIPNAMKINKLNYEAYAIDYLEGALSAEDRKAFEAFLKKNPGIKQELDDYLGAPLMEDVGGEAFVRKAAVKQRGRAGKGIIFIGLLLFGIFALGLRIGMNTQSTEAPQEELPVQKAQREVKSNKSEEKVTVKPNYMAEQLKSKKNTSVEQPSVKAEVEEIIAVNKALEVRTEKDVHQIEEHRIEIVTDLIGTEAIAVTRSSAASSRMPSPANLSKRISPALESVESLASRLMQNQVVSLEKATLMSARQAPAMETDIAYEPVEQPSSKRSRWIKILTPQSYKNVELENTIAITNLKSAVNEIEDAIVPEILITK